jgi:DNA-directed RNA polymerase specialized sigma24 family protein
MPAAEESAQYANAEEVLTAIQALSDHDYAKLMMIARIFCKRRRFSTSVLEPEELLSQAFAKTLHLEKRWNKKVALLRHLDRAMENISGHLAAQRNKIVPFPEGLEPSPQQRGQEPTEDGADEMLMQNEDVEHLLRTIFGDDTQAAEIFVLRAEGFGASQIQRDLKLTTSSYETVTKRMRRKISAYLNQQNT